MVGGEGTKQTKPKQCGSGNAGVTRALSNRTASQWLHKALPENPTILTGSGSDYRALSNRTTSQWPHKALPEKPTIPTGSGSDYRALSNRTASQWPHKALPEKPTIPTGSGSDYRALSNRTASQWPHKALPENPGQKNKSRRGQGRHIPHPISNGPVNLDQERPSSGRQQCDQQQEACLPPT